MTLVEMTVSASIAAILLILGVKITLGMSRTSTSAHRQTTISVRVAEAANMLARDLQVAGIVGEDRNASGTLSPGEDTNNNGILDADWSLADGASATSITFNRVENRWVWTTAITWQVTDGVLLRTQDGNVREICRGVTDFTVERNDTRVDISVTCEGTDGQGEVWSETADRRVYVRN